VVAALRRPVARLHLLRGRVAVALGRGRFAEARALNEETIAIAERGGDFGAAATARSLRLGMAASTGDEPGDLAWVRRQPSRMHPMAALTRAQVARLLFERGEHAEAGEWYASLPEPGSPRVPVFIALALEGMRAQVLPEFGDPATAEAVHRLLLPYADLHLVGGAGAPTTGGSVRLALGIAARVAGKPDAAVRHLRTAVAVNDASGLAHPAVLARLELAVALRACGRPSDVDESIGLLAEADAAAARMGMVPLRAHIAELRAAAEDGGVLSRREAEIAELVGRGLTNRQIAATAHISERTVETHVGHVLAKLGFSRRSEIAVWAAARPR
jgi:DNA-binding CsgD family transcriptional regulator